MCAAAAAATVLQTRKRTPPGGLNSLPRLRPRAPCAVHDVNTSGMSCQCESARARPHVCACVARFVSHGQSSFCRTARTARAEQVLGFAFPVTLSFSPLGDGAGPGKRGGGKGEGGSLPAHALPRPPPPNCVHACDVCTSLWWCAALCAACVYASVR
jgi:hypothetical protein